MQYELYCSFLCLLLEVWYIVSTLFFDKYRENINGNPPADFCYSCESLRIFKNTVNMRHSSNLAGITFCGDTFGRLYAALHTNPVYTHTYTNTRSFHNQNWVVNKSCFLHIGA